jgi:hypothetical protein
VALGLSSPRLFLLSVRQLQAEHNKTYAIVWRTERAGSF